MEDNNELTVQFRKEVKVINLRYEYPGYRGEEKYALVTALTKQELFVRYDSLIQRFVPFLLLNLHQGEAIYAARRNDDKFRKRLSRGDQIYLEEVTESVYGKYLEDDFVQKQNNKEKIAYLYWAIDQLTPVQKRRIVDYYINEMKLKDIAEKENVSIGTIQSSLNSALIKLRKILRKKP